MKRTSIAERTLKKEVDHLTDQIDILRRQRNEIDAQIDILGRMRNDMELRQRELQAKRILSHA